MFATDCMDNRMLNLLQNEAGMSDNRGRTALMRCLKINDIDMVNFLKHFEKETESET